MTLEASLLDASSFFEPVDALRTSSCWTSNHRVCLHKLSSWIIGLVPSPGKVPASVDPNVRTLQMQERLKRQRSLGAK